MARLKDPNVNDSLIYVPAPLAYKAGRAIYAVQNILNQCPLLLAFNPHTRSSKPISDDIKAMDSADDGLDNGFLRSLRQSAPDFRIVKALIREFHKPVYRR